MRFLLILLMTATFSAHAGDVSPDAGNPSFDIDVNSGGYPIKVRLPFHQTSLGQPDFVYSPWIPVSAYPALRTAAWQSQAAFDTAVNMSAWGNFYAQWYTSPQSRFVCRGMVAQTLIPQPTAALGLPP